MTPSGPYGERSGRWRQARALAAVSRVIVLAAVFGLSSHMLAPAFAKPDSGTTTLSKAELERQKLREEIRQLELENRNSSGVLGFIATYGTLLTAIAAVAGILVTLRAQRREQANQREQRQFDSQRQLDDRFAAILAELGSESEPVRAGAAVAMLTFLRRDRTPFHHQVRLATLANLKVSHPQAIHKLLVRTFEEAIRSAEPLEPAERDLSQAALEEAQLDQLDLSGANLRAANLRRANLHDTKLREADGRGVVLEQARVSGAHATLFNARLPEARAAGARFQGAELVNAHLEDADLQGADFRGARMQAAHLDRAKLQGARFDGANLADTYLRDAELDDAALSSLRRSPNWEKSHLSPFAEARLRELGQQASGN